MIGGTTGPAGFTTPPQTPRSGAATPSNAWAGAAFEPHARLQRFEGAAAVSLTEPARGGVAIDVPRSLVRPGVDHAAA